MKSGLYKKSQMDLVEKNTGTKVWSKRPATLTREVYSFTGCEIYGVGCEVLIETCYNGSYTIWHKDITILTNAREHHDFKLV